MAMSKGPGAPGAKEGMKARGYSPAGHGPHGGHHRHEPKQVSVNPVADHMRNNPAARNTIAGAPPMGNVGSGNGGGDMNGDGM